MSSKRKMNGDEDGEDEEEFEVEEIRQSRVHKRRTEYLVKWKGFTKCSWIRKSNLQCDELVAAFEATKKTKTSRKTRVANTPKATTETQNEHKDEEVSAPNESNKLNRDARDKSLGAPPPRLRSAAGDEAKTDDRPEIERAKALDPTNGEDETGGQYGVDREEGSVEAKDAEEPEYEYGFDEEFVEPPVESILKKRIESGRVEYLVRRENADEPDWEAIESINCDEMIAAFERRVSNANRPIATTPVRPENANRAPGKRKRATGQPLTVEIATLRGPGKKKARVNLPPPSVSVPSRLGGPERAYLGKMVAFSPAVSMWLKHGVYAGVGAAYIVGRISDYKYTKKQGLYEIRWLDSMFQNQVENVSVAVVK
jgi:hypothetical protein